MWSYFVKTSLQNLRIALSMSPSGDLLRTRCRSYPGLVSSTTIDWMFPWPEQALVSVANVTLSDVIISSIPFILLLDYLFRYITFIFVSESKHTGKFQRHYSGTHGAHS